MSYPAVSLYGEAADSSSRFDVTEGGNGLCGGAPVAQCGHPVREGLGAVDCEGTTACNAVSGFDGPSGVGTPDGLGLFQAQPPLAAISPPSAPSAGSAARFAVTGFSDPYPGGSLASASWSWGDGTKGSGTSATHAYSAAGSYSVTLTVTDAYGVSSAPISTTVVVGDSGSPVGAPATGATSAPQSTPSAGPAASGVQQAAAGLGAEGLQASEPPGSVSARLAGRLLSVGPSGTVSIRIACSGTAGRCWGTLSLATLTRIGVRPTAGNRSMLTLAQAPFSVAGGKTATITLHLSARARALLARSRTLSAVARMIVHDPAGATRKSATTVTLRAARRPRARG